MFGLLPVKRDAYLSATLWRKANSSSSTASWQQDGSLQGIKAAVHADAHMMVAAVLAVAGDLPHNFGKFVVVRENRPTVAVAA
jgi:hypothetical protein